MHVLGTRTMQLLKRDITAELEATLRVEELEYAVRWSSFSEWAVSTYGAELVSLSMANLSGFRNHQVVDCLRIACRFANGNSNTFHLISLLPMQKGCDRLLYYTRLQHSSHKFVLPTQRK